MSRQIQVRYAIEGNESGESLFARVPAAGEYIALKGDAFFRVMKVTHAPDGPPVLRLIRDSDPPFPASLFPNA